MPEAQEQTRATHTAGPWEWEREGNQLASGEPCNRDPVISIRHDRGFQYLSISDADRALVKAAPDLLKAAKRALAVLKAQGESVRPTTALGALDAAIRKAEGH